MLNKVISVLNGYKDHCCHDVKYKVVTGFSALILFFAVGFEFSKVVNSEKYDKLKEEIINSEVKIKELETSLGLKEKELREVTANKAFVLEIKKHKEEKEHTLRCNNEKEKIKEAYIKAACVICKKEKSKK